MLPYQDVLEITSLFLLSDKSSNGNYVTVSIKATKVEMIISLQNDKNALYTFERGLEWETYIQIKQVRFSRSSVHFDL